MSESAFYDESYPNFPVPDREQDRIFRQALELEKELMKTKRAEKVLREMERRFLSLMDSAVFLYFILTPGGAFRVLNRRAEEFFGLRLQSGAEVTLHSLSGPGYMQEVDSMLKEAMEKPTHVTFPVVRTDGSLGWLDMEFCRSSYQGETSIQAIAADITDLMKGKTDGLALPSLPNARNPFDASALPILNSCPGLLCFAVDEKGDLLYATRGYREISKRFMGHECTPGRLYPHDLGTAFAAELRALIQDAILGRTAMSSIVEEGKNGSKQWNVTSAPLTSADSGKILGAVVHLTSLPGPCGPDLSGPKTDRREQNAPSQAEFLNAIPEMLCAVDDKGLCVEANSRFLSVLKMPRDAVVGRPFADLALQGDIMNERLAEKLVQAIRGGFSSSAPIEPIGPIECKVRAGDDEILFLSLRGLDPQKTLPWGENAKEAVTLLACADNTKLRRTEEQLRRVSTTDASTGLPNRQSVERALSAEIGRASRYGGPLSLILLEAENFRELNARVGYAAGDQILRDLAVALKSQVRPTDFLGRWSSDEFVLLTPQTVEAACRTAEKIVSMTRGVALGGTSDGGGDDRLTLIAGVAEYRKDMEKDMEKGMGAAALITAASERRERRRARE